MLSDCMVYWYMALLERPPMRRSWLRLQVHRGHRQSVQLRPQAVDDLRGADLALRSGA